MLPTPARLRWSSRASPIVRAGPLRSRLIASSGSQSGPRTSGPRWPTRWCSSDVLITARSWTRYPVASHRSLPSNARIMCSGCRRGRSPARVRYHDPSMRRWLCTDSPSSMRMRMCLPRADTPMTLRPVRSAVANGRHPQIEVGQHASAQGLIESMRGQPDGVAFGHLSPAGAGHAARAGIRPPPGPDRAVRTPPGHRRPARPTGGRELPRARPEPGHRRPAVAGRPRR